MANSPTKSDLQDTLDQIQSILEGAYCSAGLANS
jgi:hypothetical protein